MKHQSSLLNKIAKLTVLLAGVIAFCTAWALILPAITITDDAATEDQGFYLGEEQGSGTSGNSAADGQTASAEAPVEVVPEGATDAAVEEAAPEEVQVGDTTQGAPTDSQADAQPAAETDGSASEPAMPPQDLTEMVDLGDNQILEVRVEAEEGVLPDGVTLHLDKELKDEHIDLMRAEAEKKAGIEEASSFVLGTDITFEDADGTIVEPKGKVLVTFTSPAIEPDASFAIAHVAEAENPDDPNDRDKANIVVLKKSEPAQNQVQFEATDFSPYAIVYIPAAEDDEQEAAEPQGALTDADEGDGDNNEGDSNLPEDEEDAEGEDGDDAQDAEAADDLDMPAQSFTATVEAEDGSLVDVVVDADEGTFPADVAMQAAWVTDDAVVEAAKTEAVTQTDMDAEAARALAVDIAFTDADGNTIEPVKPVHVAMVSQDITRQGELVVVHVDDDKNAQMLEGGDSHPNLGAVYFDAEQFSVYALIYTVDFRYELDGKVYEFNMAGGDAISLSDMLTILQIVQADDQIEAEEAVQEEAEAEDQVIEAAEDAEAAEDGEETEAAPEKPLASVFIADVATVEFTDESLLKVVSVDEDTTAGALKESLGVEPEYSAELTEEDIADINAKAFTAPDWALLSLKAFDTDEALTVTLKDGEVFEIKITDAVGGQWEVWFDGTLGQSAQTNQFYEGASNVRTTAWPNTPVTLPDVGAWVNGQRVTSPNKYDYVLNGWYEITGTGADKKANWHAVGERVTITKDTVFYADWVPASYSKGPSGGSTVLDTPDTSSFVTTELFDYNELLNVNFTNNPSVNIVSPWGSSQNQHTETWAIDGEFAFTSWNYHQNPNRALAFPNAPDSLPLASTYRGATLTPGIYGRNASTINKLFDGSEMVGKTIVGTGGHLFNYKDATGEYYYDSDLNAATYNQGHGRFYVYQGTEDINSLTNFLPYNDYPGGSSVSQNTGATNYWFGMKNTIDFYLPDDVGTPGTPSGNKNPVNNEAMEFKFSGDDDVWVFVDGQLVLDLGGVHDRATGTINFATGTVTTWFGTLNNQATTPVTTTNPALAALKEGNHTLTVLYLERGSSFSNCSIYFNLLPAPKIAVEKQIVGLEGLTDQEIADYKNKEFAYEVRVGTTFENSILYNTPSNPKDRQKVIKTKQDGTTELITITNGQVTLKHGERITIQDLPKDTNVYVAELNTSVMSEFETPKATRMPKPSTSEPAPETENLALDAYTSQNQSATNGWTTVGSYNPGNTDVITFQNTVKKRTSLNVEKVWAGNEAAPEGAALDVVVKRYKLVPDPSAQPATGSLIINDSYTGLPSYSAEYRITGNGVDQTVTGSGESITVSDLPIGTYTVEKTASVPYGYTATNTTETKTATVTAGGGSVTFGPTVYEQAPPTTDKMNLTIKFLANTSTYPDARIHPYNFTLANSNWENDWSFSSSPTGLQLPNSSWTINDLDVTGGGGTLRYRMNVNPSNAVITSVSANGLSVSYVNDVLRIPAQTGTYTIYICAGVTPPASASSLAPANAPRLFAASTLAVPSATGIGLRSTNLELVNTGTNPSISGYVWEEDTSWSQTVHLSKTDGWSKTLEDLEQFDSDGNLYAYYIASASETGVPAGTVAIINNDGTNKLFVYGDHGGGDNDTLRVTNTLPTEVSINIRKVNEDASKRLTGAKFVLRKYADESYQGIEHTYPEVSVDENGEATIGNLTAGYYMLEETQVPAGYVKTSENPRFQITRNPQGSLTVAFTNTDTVAYESGTFIVRNQSGAELPMTGGSGGLALTTVGVLLATTCVALAAYKRVRFVRVLRGRS